MAEAFRDVDLLLAPATPCPAPPIGQRTLELDGQTVLLRPSLGLYTQPISCVGLPVVCVPAAPAGALPVGIQLIAAPWREATALAAARRLETLGVAVAHLPDLADGA
jgi:Asp-tRNA(Asn)/Glu-tRNA(Gln) amidotransferase A subunit family amidase